MKKGTCQPQKKLPQHQKEPPNWNYQKTLRFKRGDLSE